MADRTTAASVNLTLDGTLDDYRVRPGAMRWVPPEQAAAIRAAVREGRTAKPKTLRTRQEAARG